MNRVGGQLTGRNDGFDVGYKGGEEMPVSNLGLQMDGKVIP